MNLHETTKLALLNMAMTLLNDRIPSDETTRVITAEAVVEEARKLEEIFYDKPKNRSKKAQFLIE